MTTQNIKTGIQQLARENYSIYSDGYSYRPEGGELNEEERKVAIEVAEGYWENRNESEEERDEEAGVTYEDYERWVIAAIEEAAKERADEADYGSDDDGYYMVVKASDCNNAVSKAQRILDADGDHEFVDTSKCHQPANGKWRMYYSKRYDIHIVWGDEPLGGPQGTGLTREEVVSELEDMQQDGGILDANSSDPVRDVITYAGTREIADRDEIF